MVHKINRRSLAFSLCSLALLAGCLGSQGRFSSSGAPILAPAAGANIHGEQGDERSAAAAWARSRDLPRRWSAAPENEIASDIAPDERSLAYVADPDGHADIYLLSLPPAPLTPPRRLASSPAQERSPRFSPDGRKIAYISTLDDAFGDLWVVEISSGKARRLTDRETRDADPVWTPDGRALIFSAARGEAPPALERLELKSGLRETLAAQPAREPDLSPDGRLVVFCEPDEDGLSRALGLLDLRTGETKTLLRTASPVSSPRWDREGRGVIAVHYSDDTNRDDRLDTKDRRALWYHAVDAESALISSRPLTQAGEDCFAPAPFRGGFFFSRAGAGGGGADLFSFAMDGAVGAPPAGSPEEAAAWIERLERDRANEPELILCAWRNAAASADPALVGRARIEEIRRLIALGRLAQAEALAAGTQADSSTLPLYKNLAEIERWRARVALVDRDTADAAAQKAAREQALEALAPRTLDPDMAGAEAKLLAAQWLLDLERLERAVQLTDGLLRDFAGRPEILTRALLLRARLQERFGEGEAMTASWARILREFPERRSEALEAARRMADRTLASGASPEENRRRLREFIAAAATPPLARAMAQNRVGDLFAAEDRLAEALDAYQETIEKYAEETEAAAAAYFAVARIYFDQGAFGESVRAYERIERRLRPREDAFYLQARKGYIRQTLLKAEAEWRAGDPQLARATFVSLLDYDPQILEAWRGILRSDAALGRVAATLKQIETRLRPAPADPALRYARGLALTYLPGREKDARRDLESAQRLDPASPYPHQTLGYLYEQRNLRGGAAADAERALLEYQIALALSDPEIAPHNVAALKVNAGNAARLLELWGLAHTYYCLRTLDPQPHEDPRTEYLFLRHAAQAAFYAGESSAAADLYARALEVLPAAREKDAGATRTNWEEQETELLDRRALALQEAGRYAEAAALFDRVAGRASDPKSAALARRNVGVNLYLESRALDPAAREDRLRRAWRAFSESRAAVERIGVIAPHKRETRGGGALLGVSAVVGLGGEEGGGAGMGFDRPAELRLLDGFLGWIAEADENPAAALAAIDAQLRGFPKLDDTNRAYLLTEKAVLLSRRAALEERRGDPAAAARATLDSLDCCRWKIAGEEEFINARGAVTAAMNLARLWILAPEAIPASASENWLARRAAPLPGEAQDAGGAAIERTLRSAAALLELPEPPPAALLLPEVWLCQGAVALRRAEEAGGSPAAPREALAADRALAARLGEALALFRRAEARCGEQIAAAIPLPAPLAPEDRERQRRLLISAVLYQARALRALGQDAATETAERGLRLAQGWGYEALAFGYLFEEGLALADSEARLALWRRAAEMDEAALPGLREDSPLLRAARATLAAALARAAADSGDWEQAWLWSEWAQARALAAQLDSLAPEMEGEAASKAARELRAIAREARSLLTEWRRREAAADPPPQAMAARLAALRAAWEETLDSARAADPSAWALLSGRPLAPGDVMDLLEPGHTMARFAWLGDSALALTLSLDGLQGARVEDADGSLAAALRFARDPQAPAEALDLLAARLLPPLEPALDGAQILEFSADSALAEVPFDLLRDPANGEPLMLGRAIAWTPTLAHHYLCETRRSPWRRRVVALGPARAPDPAGEVIAATFASESADQAGAPPGPRDAFDAGRRADLLRMTCLLDLDARLPAASRALLDSASAAPGGAMPLRDFFASGWGASLAAFERVSSGARGSQGDPAGNAAARELFLTALAWGGAPAAILPPASPDAAPEDDAVFWSGFWKALASASPAQALLEARRAALDAGADPRRMAGFRLWGHPGMSPEAAQLFAEERLDERLLRAREAYLAADWPRAAREFSRVLDLFDLLELTGADDPRVTKSAELLASAADRAGDAALALRGADRTVAEYEAAGAPPVELAGALRFAASVYDRARAREQAAETARRAVELQESLDDPGELLEALGQWGVILENAQRYNEAIGVFERARTLCDELEAPEESAAQWRRIGRVRLLYLGQWDAAERDFEAARAIYSETGEERGEAEAILDLALVAERRADFDRALERYEAAEAAASRLEDPALAARAALGRANVHWLTGAYLESLRAQQAALDLAGRARNAGLALAARNTAGLIRWALNDYGRAQEEFEAALELSRRLGLPDEESSTLNNLGLVWRSRGDYPRALDSFRAALAVDQRFGLPWGEAYDHRNIGMTLLLSGDPAGAAESLGRAARMAEELGDPVNRAKALLSLGDARRALGLAAEAQANYTEALATARERRIQEVEWRALQGQAALAQSAGNRAAAIELLGQAIDRVEVMRASIRVEELQDGFLADKQGLYEQMILLLLDEGRGADAFEFSERARARGFIDLLGNQRLEVGRPEDQEFLERDRELRATAERLRARLATDLDAAERDAALRELEAAEKQSAELLERLRIGNPALTEFLSVQPIRLEELFALLGEEATLVEYFLAREETIAWVAREGRLDVIRIPERRDSLLQALDTYRRRIQALEDTAALSRDLHARLFAPVAPYVRGSRRLAIVPHGALHYLSFASLSDGREAVVDRFALFYLPSASVYRYTRERRRAAAEGPVRALAIGNPDLGNPNLDLPFAEKEAERMVWDFPEATTLTGERATRDWVEENAARYSIVHIASHGEFDSLNPLYSALLLAPGERYEDGRLSVRDVLRLTLNADLVTLSACESGLGRLSTGDDQVGLSRAFLYAGAHTLVSSLWRVDDIATAVMVKHFYRNYTASDKAEALRRAQIQVRRQRPHPAYWAGLILTGDWK